MGGSILGEVEYANGLQPGLQTSPGEQAEPGSLARAGGLPWETLAERLERLGGIRREEILEKVRGLKYQAVAQGLRPIVARLETGRECGLFAKALPGA